MRDRWDIYKWDGARWVRHLRSYNYLHALYVRRDLRATGVCTCIHRLTEPRED